ncbi:MAG: subclass B1 metallo-beta-lactamase, partial [Methylococcaceae bacterium]
MKSLLTALLLLLFLMAGYAQEYTRIRISEDLELIKLSEHAYVHVSWENSPVYGRFSSNGLIYLHDGEGYLLDTPATDALTKTLVGWIADSLKTRITGFVPNHWHSDCLGGLHYLQTIGVNSYAHQITIDIARSKGLAAPAHGFRDSLTLQLKGNSIQCYYLGAAHSMDNIVVWLPEEKILFAGCMAKEAAAKGMGNTVDGDLLEWPKTIDKVMAKFP